MYAATAPYSSPDPSKVKAAVADWLQSMTPPEDSSTTRFAVTLTLNVEAMHRKARTGVLEREDRVELAKSTFAAFRWKLDRLILKSAATKYGRELTYVPVIEGQRAGHRIHYHCVIVTPSWVTLPAMQIAVRKAWERTEFGDQQLRVTPMYDEEWLLYMSKEAWTVKRDVVDIDNVRLSTSPQRC